MNKTLFQRRDCAQRPRPDWRDSPRGDVARERNRLTLAAPRSPPRSAGQTQPVFCAPATSVSPTPSCATAARMLPVLGTVNLAAAADVAKRAPEETGGMALPWFFVFCRWTLQSC